MDMKADGNFATRAATNYFQNRLICRLFSWPVFSHIIYNVPEVKVMSKVLFCLIKCPKHQNIKFTIILIQENNAHFHI